MAAHDNGGPAFPVIPPLDSGGGSATGYPYADSGMTLRDYFAAKAMLAAVGSETAMEILNDRASRGDVALPDLMARTAYAIADAMLKARSE